MSHLVFIGIGNSDNKLTQREWSDFVANVEGIIVGLPTHGAWFSRPDAPWQNACWCVDFTDQNPRRRFSARRQLRALAKGYQQDSIAWSESETEFLAPFADDVGQQQETPAGDTRMNEEQQFQQLINRLEEAQATSHRLTLELANARDECARLRAALNNERDRANRLQRAAVAPA